MVIEKIVKRKDLAAIILVIVLAFLLYNYVAVVGKELTAWAGFTTTAPRGNVLRTIIIEPTALFVIQLLVLELLLRIMIAIRRVLTTNDPGSAVKKPAPRKR
jgi:hypothetical protein